MNRLQRDSRDRHIIHQWESGRYSKADLAYKHNLTWVQIARIIAKYTTPLKEQHRQQNIMELDLREKEGDL